MEGFLSVNEYQGRKHIIVVKIQVR